VPESILFLIMAGIFALLAMGFRIPIGVSLALAALAGALFGGEGFAIRHLVEGAFSYFETILIILTAMIFMKVLQSSGILDSITVFLLKTFHRKKIPLLFTVMVLIMFPGMITGSSSAAVLSTGVLVAPVLMRLGLSKIKAAALIAMGAILGMIAPPVNVLVMIMGAGVDMPYIGMTVPLLIIVIPLAVVTSLWLGYKDIKVLELDQLDSILPESLFPRYGYRLYLPLVFVLGSMLVQSFLAGIIPDTGIPAVFLAGSLIGLFCGRRLNFLAITQEAIREAIPILSILAGVGMFIQIMTLTGGRGWVVLSFLSLPPALLYVGIGISLPLFGAVSAYGSASILGVPFILAMINKNAVITASALSAIAGLGDLMPPTALAGMFAAQVVEEKNYFRVLRLCIVPGLFELAMGMGFLFFAPFIDKII
jgi:GntP family gluconate:H+ symporter